MSDNPADSLRRELEAVLKRYWLSTWVERKDRTEQEQLDIQAEEYSEEAFDNIWPLILAALEAARADERERIEAVIRSVVVGHFDPKQKILMERVRDRCAELVAVSDGN